VGTLQYMAPEQLQGKTSDARRNERTISLLAISVSHLEVPAIVQLELPLGLASSNTA
jgi:hypothetical protein